MEKDSRIIKMMFIKNGSGYVNARIPIPKNYYLKIGITKEDRECKVTLDENKIIIEKRC